MHRDVCTLSVHQLKLWTSLQRVGLFRVVLKLWIICFAEFCRNKFLQKNYVFPLQIFKCFVQSSVWPKVSRKAITSCLWRGQLKWPGKERKRWRRKCNYVISSPLFLNLTKNQFWPKTQNELEWVWRARSHLKTVQTTFMKTVFKMWNLRWIWRICRGDRFHLKTASTTFL